MRETPEWMPIQVGFAVLASFCVHKQHACSIHGGASASSMRTANERHSGCLIINERTQLATVSLSAAFRSALLTNSPDFSRIQPSLSALSEIIRRHLSDCCFQVLALVFRQASMSRRAFSFVRSFISWPIEVSELKTPTG